MVYFAGWQGRLNWYDGSNYSALGAVQEFNAEIRTTTARDDGIGTRKRYANGIVEAQPVFSFRYSPQDFNFIQRVFITNDNNMSKFGLRYFDGQEYGTVQSCFVNTFTLEINHGRDVQATVDGFAHNISGGDSTYTFAAQITTPPISFRQVGALSVFGASVVDDFRRFSLTLNNNIRPDITGATVIPADLLEGKCDYSGTIELAKKTNISAFVSQLNASNGVVQYQLVSREGTPVTATFNFAESAIATARVQLPTGLVIQRIDWTSNNLSFVVA